MQAGCDKIETEGVPTNGNHPPFLLGNYSVQLGKVGDGVISFLLEITLLVTVNNHDNKGDDTNQDHGKIAQVGICNHPHHPFLSCGKREMFRPPFVVPLPGHRPQLF